MKRQVRCPNMNHSRTRVTVRFCPRCGEVVNAKVPMRVCGEAEHAKRRREQNEFCVDCGGQLIG